MTDDHRSGVCPGPEQLAAYIDGRVTGEERASIQQHLADCEDCREVVADTVRLRDESPRPDVLPFWRRRKTQAIGGGVLALAASLILVVQVRPDLNPWRRPTPYEELVAAVGTNRRVEPMVTGFSHGPLRRSTRSNESDPDYRVLGIAGQIQELANQHPSPENLHALGVAHLARGDLDAAVAALSDAVRRDPKPSYQNDLAAAYLERAIREQRNEDAARALDLLQRAGKTDTALLEAQFNRALALERLGELAEAQEAWKSFLLLDRDSGWAQEARRHLADSPRVP